MIVTIGVNLTDRELAVRAIKMARREFSEVDYRAVVAVMADNGLIEECEAVRLEHEEPWDVWRNV